MEYLVPALDRGLRLAAFLADSSEGQTFSACARHLGVTNAVASRLLQTLAHYGWAEKASDGHWHPGPLVAGRRDSLASELRRRAEPVLQDLASESGATALLVLRQDDTLVHAAKTLHPHGMVMREVGSRRSTFLTHPWGLAILHALDGAERDRLLAAEGAHELPADTQRQFEADGCCMSADDAGGHRLATALRLADGRVPGALALGGSFGDARLTIARRTLTRYAAVLAAMITTHT